MLPNNLLHPQLTREDLFSIRTDPAMGIMIKWLRMRETEIENMINKVKDNELDRANGLIIRLREVRYHLDCILRHPDGDRDE